MDKYKFVHPFRPIFTAFKRKPMSRSLFETREYPIYFGELGLRALDESLRNQEYSSVFVLVDEHTLDLCWPILHHHLSSIQEAQILRIPTGEEHKDLDTCSSIWQQLHTQGADRQSLLINLGGGVITDMGGFAAATFKRGIDFIHIPTTLLSQVDASVGGKLGVDFQGSKNQIGVFAHPKAVLIFPEFLKTLSKKQYLSGFAEVVKHGLIADSELWEKCLATPLANPEDLMQLIYTSVRIKYRFVQQDPKDHGARQALNFGHTVGHALESHFLMDEERLSILHGEAVAAGMIVESYLSYRVLGLPHEELDQISDFLFALYGAVALRADEAVAILDWMRQDKKNTHGQIRFSLIPSVGSYSIGESCPDDLILAGLNYYIQRAEMQNKKD